MVNKKVVITCTIVALVLVAAIIAINIRKFNEIDYTEFSVNNETNEITNNVEENLIDEEILEDNEVDEENTSTVEEINSYQGEEETASEENNNEEKALELAKNEWGEDDSVYYTVDNQSGNIYYISVRDKSTTASLAEYKINVSTGEVSDY